jgi:GNAT superfamily N-acetyltransferase
VIVEPLTEATLPGLLALFRESHSACFCRYWHFTGNKNEWLERCAFKPEDNAAELTNAFAEKRSEANGLVAIVEESDIRRVVGWMKLAPASPKLRSLSVYRSLDLGQGPTIGCMLVHPDWRHRGVARALVEAAPLGTLAFPRRSPHPLSDEEAWQGPEHVFLDAGFTPDASDGPYPVLRRSSLK